MGEGIQTLPARSAVREPLSEQRHGWSAGMEAAGADIGASGREPVLTEYLSFDETFGDDLTEVAVATGAYDKKGKTWAIIIYVNKDNPLTELTMAQLDGIFGAQRTGGYKGYKWMPEYARGAQQKYQDLGAIGPDGKWANEPIQTYGYANTGMTNFFQLKVFHNGITGTRTTASTWSTTRRCCLRAR